MSSRKCQIEQIWSGDWRQQILRLAGSAPVSVPNIFSLKSLNVVRPTVRLSDCTLYQLKNFGRC